jgi:hypothetical protein
MAADVGAAPVHRGGAQSLGEAASEKRQVRHVGRLRGTRRSAYHRHQQESTHRNAPSDTLNLAQSSPVNLNQSFSRAPIGRDLVEKPAIFFLRPALKSHPPKSERRGKCPAPFGSR